MVIHRVEFAGSVVSPKQPLPGDLPQIAFAGRSNVGKSSLINRLLGRTRRKVARVSAAPGKTQALNFYRVNGSFFLVDLPGSGYARAPKAVRESWGALVRSYLSGQRGQGSGHNLRGVVYLVDSRRPPARTDRDFVDFLSQTGSPTLIALTKTDKLKSKERQRGVVGPTVEALGVTQDQIVKSSARTGEGTHQLLAAMETLLETEP